ncbi:hypothetical protein ACU21_03450 [Actinobaculum suis]|nr:hypothetical protein ACU20_04870 [Actinobaculum suis]OCA95576.1 hypothetical protein ACU21_03450 [Actinobaculum suis]
MVTFPYARPVQVRAPLPAFPGLTGTTPYSGRGRAYPATTFAAVCNAGHRAYILPVPYRTSARFRTPGVGIRTPGAGRTPRAANSYLPRTPTYRELRLTASMEKTPQILRVINQ